MKPASTLRNGLLALAAVPFAAATAQAAEPPRFSWGKAGVGYDQLRAEAYDCAMVGLSSDVDDSAPVEALRTATRRMEALDGNLQGIGSASDPVAAGSRYATDVQAVRAAARPERQVEALKQIVFREIRQCMVERGYTRFALTEDQRTEMARFEDGTQERRAFLHKLASDAAVLEQQRQPLPE